MRSRRTYSICRRAPRPGLPVWTVLGQTGEKALITSDEDLAMLYALEGYTVEGRLPQP